MYMTSINGGLEMDPRKEARFVKDELKNERVYTFRGVYEMDIANSTEFRTVSRRVATEVDETDPNWRVIRLD
jgi:hypothetical protein